MNRCWKILILLGVAFAAVLLIPLIHHYQLRFAVASYISKLKAQGEPMDLARVIPPPVPPDQNGVPLITHALANLKSEGVVANNPPPAMLMVARGRAMIGWQQPDLRISGRNSWDDLGRELAAAKNDLASFQTLADHPVLDFNLDYQKGADIQIPHLAPLKRSAQWLSASALYDLHQEDPKSACADVRALLALVKGETDEWLIISQLVRIAIASIGSSATWEILQNPNVSDDDLAQLQQDWQSLEFTRPTEQAMMFERVEGLQGLAQIRKSSEKFDEIWGDFYKSGSSPNRGGDLGMPQKTRSLFLRKWDELRWRWFWSYQDELSGLRAFQSVIDAARMDETNESSLLAQSFALARLNQNASYDLHNYFSQSVSAMPSMLRRTARIETCQNAVVTAIALKRYELRHQQLPATLDDLTPDLLKAVPIDCMDGQPLRYRPKADGTLMLYSVGENGKDEGGDTSLEKGVTGSNFYWQNDHALDWVWPQPATPAEIQSFYARQKNSR